MLRKQLKETDQKMKESSDKMDKVFKDLHDLPFNFVKEINTGEIKDFENHYNQYVNRINQLIYKKTLVNVNEKIEIVINILELIKEIIKAPETEIIHSWFDTKEDLINELDNHILKLTEEDFSKIEDLIILFAPTSDLQEISIDSGWGKQFLIISERFDSAIKDLIKEFNIKLKFRS